MNRTASSLVPSLVVALLAVLPFLPSVGGEFLDYDDPYLISANPQLPSAGLGPLLDPRGDRVAYGSEYLPVRDLTYLVDARLTGRPDGQGWLVPPDAAPWFRTVNLIWYAIACGLGVLVLLGLPPALRPPPPVAVLAGLLFAWHPAHAESVAWIAGRKDVVSGALALGAIAVHLRARRGDAPPLYVASALLAGLACLAKSTATAIPALILAIELADPESTSRRRLVRALPTLLVCGLLALLAMWVGRKTGIAQPWRSPLLVGLVDLVVLRRYLVTTVVPLRLQVDHGDLVQAVTPIGSSLTGFPWLQAGLALLVLAPLAVLVVWRWRQATVRFGALWFLAGLLPVLNLVPFVHWIADRFLFLSLLGPCLLAAWALGRVRDGQKGLLIAATVLALLAGRTTARAIEFRSSEALWRAQLRTDPQSPLARSHVGQALLARAETPDQLLGAANELAVAAAGFTRLRAPSPAHELETRLHLGDALRALERWNDALASYQEALVAMRRTGLTSYAAPLRQRLDALAGQALDAGPAGVEVSVRALVLSEREALAREALAGLERDDPARARALGRELELRD